MAHRGRSLSGWVLVFGLLLQPTLLFAKDAYQLRSLSSCEAFPTNDAVGDLFDALVVAHPEIARAFVIGRSVEGRDIHALRLSAEPEVESMEPEARIIGAIHGNECMGVEVVLAIVEWMISRYGADSRVTRLIDDAELVFVPLVNPDGYSHEQASRENSNGVDLNRNLHFAWLSAGGVPFSEPETRALRGLSQENSFTLGISYHTVSYYVNGPWNYTPHHPPDEALFQTMGEAYAGDSPFVPVFGWDWYDIQGDVNDWSLGTRGTFDWTLELMSDTDPQWEINREGVAAFLSYLFVGVEGRVTDAETGDPLAARIDITPRGVPVFTDPDVGDYHRVLLPGRYDLRVVAEGYVPGIVTDIEVPEDDTVAIDVALERDPARRGYAFSVVGMSMPDRIARTRYDTESYPNDTMVWEALGAPDGRPYSLCAHPDSLGESASSDLDRPVGSITLDMGETTPVANVAGADLRVVSATENDDAAAVLISDAEDGPFIEAVRGRGSMSVDIGRLGFDTIRYVRVLDLNSDRFDTANSGYDLDGVVNLSMGREGPDGGEGPAGDAGEPDGGERDITAMSGGCTCGVAGNRLSTISLMFHLLDRRIGVWEF